MSQYVQSCPCLAPPGLLVSDAFTRQARAFLVLPAPDCLICRGTGKYAGNGSASNGGMSDRVPIGSGTWMSARGADADGDDE